jgi:hypothetical protein
MPLLNTCNVVIHNIKTVEKSGRRGILHRARICQGCGLTKTRKIHITWVLKGRNRRVVLKSLQHTLFVTIRSSRHCHSNYGLYYCILRQITRPRCPRTCKAGKRKMGPACLRGLEGVVYRYTGAAAATATINYWQTTPSVRVRVRVRV